MLYHAVPRLITAPVVVQELAQRHFFNALSFLVTLASLCAQALERARPQADGTAQIGDQESPAWPKLEDR